MPLDKEVGSAKATLYTTNPIIFMATTNFQSWSSNRHFALLSSPDFHAVIFFTGVMLYSVLHTKLSCSILLRFPISHLASSVLSLYYTHHHLLPSKVIIRETMTGHSTSVLVPRSSFRFRPFPMPPKGGTAAPYCSAHVCGQTVARLSYC